MSTKYTKKQVADLIDGDLDWETVRRMLFMPKDKQRFEIYREILQEKVKYDDQIVLPLGPHLNIVENKDKKLVNKCDCGYVFGPYTENWKLNAVIFVRDSEEKFKEIYPTLMAPDASWQNYREYYCPDCACQHDVEAPTPWYPCVHDFEPDIKAFYDWLDLPVPVQLA